MDTKTDGSRLDSDLSEGLGAGAAALLPCPCGAPCTADGDNLYPMNRERTLWRLHCANPECGWSVLAGSADECIKDWSRRAAPNV